MELVPEDFNFMSLMEQTSTSEGWIYGTYLTTGCSGPLLKTTLPRLMCAASGSFMDLTQS
jgi:hypothetical protein